MSYDNIYLLGKYRIKQLKRLSFIGQSITASANIFPRVIYYTLARYLIN